MENKCHRAESVPTIIADARSKVGVELWERLIGDTTIAALALDLATLGYSDSGPFAHALTMLLNTVSRLYVEVVTRQVDADAPAIVFSAHDKRYTPGDYLGVSTKSDTTAFMATLSSLLEALAESTPKQPYVSLQEWTNLLLVGEWKPKHHDRLGQLLWYLSALKRFRPDLQTTYGFFIEDKQVQLLSHNACGTGRSESAPLSGTAAWVALVIHAYACHDARDQRFESVTDNDDRLARWRIKTIAATPSTFRPFHTSPSPGRVTWLSFEQDNELPDLACGFLKVSWQDASAQFNEPDLLARAHADSWLPGLVRPRWTSRNVSDFVELHASSGAPKRVKEIVHLASIGQPLSQAASLVHLLKIIVDAIKVHELLLKVDILHRDLSWFNLLGNPWHDPSTLKDKPVRKGIPFIDFILTGKESEPNCLLLDLDHAALMKKLYADEHDARQHKSGTPMFVAVELSSDKAEGVGTITRQLMERLRALDKDEHSELLARAFPNGDNGFMAAMTQVFERERNRIDPMHDDYFVVGCGTNPKELHRARHDMESLFWVTFWALLRASPLSALVDDCSRDDLTSIGNAMLDHKLADEKFRAYFRTDHELHLVLHSLLSEKVGPLLRDMRTYISLPWHLYTATVPELPQNHAHIAFTRMLIVEIHQLSKKGNILFDRKLPRNLRSVKNFNRDNYTKPKRPLGTGSSPAVRLSQDVHRGTVGRASVDTAAGDPARSTREAASQRGSKRGTGTRDVEGDAGDAKPAPKRAKCAPDSPDSSETRDISTLVDMFFDDRILWFGVGNREETKTAACAQGHVTAQAGPGAQEGEPGAIGGGTNDVVHEGAVANDTADDGVAATVKPAEQEPQPN